MSVWLEVRSITTSLSDFARWWSSGDRRQEVVAPHDEHDRLIDSRDGRRPGHVTEEGDLPEPLDLGCPGPGPSRPSTSTWNRPCSMT